MTSFNTTYIFILAMCDNRHLGEKTFESMSLTGMSWITCYLFQFEKHNVEAMSCDSGYSVLKQNLMVQMTYK